MWQNKYGKRWGAEPHREAHGVGGDYRFEVLRGVPHWMLEENPDAVADLLLEWFAAHSV